MTVQPRSSSRRVTIKDVAARAGVSISTVSHVFSGARPISDRTSARVRQAAEDLDYRPDAVARSLRTAQTGIIGFALRPRDAIAGSLRGTQTFARLIGATAAHVLEQGRAMILVPDLLDPQARQVPMDGCILAHPYGNDPVLTHLLQRQVPLVTVDPDPDRPEQPWAVVVDYASAMRTLLAEMREQGANRILLLSGTEDNAWNRHTAQAYTEWAAGHQDVVLHERLYEGEGVAGAARAVSAALASAAPPDGVITAASTFAAGALEAIRSKRLAVPGDVLLAAWTDSEYTRNASPPITALDLNLEEAAGEAVRLLTARLSGSPEPEEPVVVEPKLFWRASTGHA